MPELPAPEAFFAASMPEPTPANVVPRDRWERPLIGALPSTEHLAVRSGPNAGLVPYSRASGFGANIDDGSNLVKWQKRQVARGMVLLEQTEHYASRIGQNAAIEPADRQAKDFWNDMARRAEDAVGSYAKADIGTAIHYATEVVDKEDREGWDQLTDFQKERARAYLRAIREWEITPTSVEVFGVQDDVLVAGTWDRTGYVFGRHCILDVKTSGTMDFAGIGFAVQLAVYAHASAYDPATRERTPHEEMDLETAWIIHVDRNAGGHVELYRVDIAMGWRYAGIARDIILARREGKKAIRQAEPAAIAATNAILRATTHAELTALDATGWDEDIKELARQRWEELG